MLRTPRISWLTVLLVGAAASFLAFEPTIWAQHGPKRVSMSAPLTAGDIDGIRAALHARSTAQSANSTVTSALERAETDVRCLVRRKGLQHSRRAVQARHHDRAATLGKAYLLAQNRADCPDLEPTDEQLADRRARARLLAATARLRQDAPTRALEHLSEIEAADTPIRDYVWWLEARALEKSRASERAADQYGRIHDLESSPLRFRARARQADLLASGDHCREALPVIEQMLELFPDYPRRARLQYQRGACYEVLGEFRKAAEAYQQTWLMFPHKPHGDRALARLETLERRGTRIGDLSRDELFDRFRQLRIYRQWELADTYFRRLLDHEATPTGHSEFEHEIWMQLALNAFEPKRNETALRYLEKLRDAHRAGFRNGIHRHIVDKYLARTLARMGRFEDALAAKKRHLDRFGRHTRRRKLVDFYREHGRYEEAYQLADSYYSNWRKRRWQYGWLLYKTGRFEEALEHFERYAGRRHGHTKAKGMYWAARSHERAGSPNEARTLYEEITREFSVDYYSVQARNRLRDLRQRKTVDSSPVASQTDSVLDGGNDVFAAFDRAAAEMSDSSSPVRIDSSLVPRIPEQSDHASSNSLSPHQCATDAADNPALCRLMAGELPDQTESAIARALAPFDSPADSEASADDSSGANRFNANSGSGPERNPTADTADGGIPPSRVNFPTRARIYWNGRHDSEVAFARFADGNAIGPVPEPRAYDFDSYLGGLERATTAAGDLFPGLERARWLYAIGLRDEAQTALREVALEFRGLAKRPRAPAGNPHELPYERWTYLVDFRPRGQRGHWGHEGADVRRFPVPEDSEKKRELANRQQKIYDRRDDIRPLLIDALQEVGDYHLVRRFTLERHDLFDREPGPLTREVWMQAYPRAFPREVIAESRRRGINPYLIWSLMGVESTYNPDSISTAEAIGLLQVIPRTGVKVATSIGDRDFGPYDLTDEEVAIDQGVWYFARLVRKFKGQELLAMAGYNGGPHRVAAWMDKRGQMPLDEFVEEIPFTQARGYVKKVTRYLATYLQLYEGRDSLYIGQNVETDYRKHPNY